VGADPADPTEPKAELTVKRVPFHFAKRLTVRGTELSPEDPAEIMHDKLTHIAFAEASAFIALLGPDGTVLECNRSALAQAIAPQADIVGRSLADVLLASVEGQENRDAVHQAVAQAAAGETARFDARLVQTRQSEPPVILDSTLRPVKDDAGNIAFVLYEAREATQECRNEAALLESREHLDPAHLGLSLETVVRHHDALRFRFAFLVRVETRVLVANRDLSRDRLQKRDFIVEPLARRAGCV